MKKCKEKSIKMDFTIKNLIDENGDSIDLIITITNNVENVFVEILDSKDRHFDFIDYEYDYYKELLNNNNLTFKYFTIICDGTPYIRIHLFDLNINEEIVSVFQNND